MDTPFKHRSIIIFQVDQAELLHCCDYETLELKHGALSGIKVKHCTVGDDVQPGQMVISGQKPS